MKQFLLILTFSLHNTIIIDNRCTRSTFKKGYVQKMKKLLFIINSVSGKRVLADSLMSVIEIFSNADYDINVYLTKSEEDMIRQVEDRGGEFDLIVCCGGDGTLNLVAGAIYENGIDTLLGYIPGGTTNDFANTRHIDTVTTGAAEQIVNGVVRDVDLGVLNGKPFVYVAAFGMFSDLAYITSREMKQNMGYAAYLMGGIKSMAKSKPYSMRIEHDGEVIDGDFIYGMVSNSKRVGGIEMPIMKNVLFDDGEMEITLVRHAKNPLDTQKLINCLVTQIADDHMVYMFKTSNVKIECTEDVPWTLDGEFGGAYSNMDIVVKGAAIKMIF